MDITSTNLNIGNNTHESSFSQIAKGSKTNSAADSPANIPIIENINKQISSNIATHRNVIDGISALQVAQGGITQITDNLQQLRELAIQAGNAILNPQDRQAIQSQANELLQNITGSISNSNFNNKSLLNINTAQTLQTGANNDSQQKFPGYDLATLLENQDLFAIDFTVNQVTATLNSIDRSLNITEKIQSGFAINQQSLEVNATALLHSNTIQNQSRSQIADTDDATALSTLTGEQFSEKVEISMLSQASTDREQVLQLLKS
ncbi:MAG: flagellin [Oceanospirillaceae bacterium]